MCDVFLVKYSKLEPKIKAALQYAKELDVSDEAFPGDEKISNEEFIEAIKSVTVMKRDIEKIKAALMSQPATSEDT